MCDTIALLWHFPRRDWQTFVEFSGGDMTTVETYDDYLRLLDTVEEKELADGSEVVRVYMSVEHMQKALMVGIMKGHTTTEKARTPLGRMEVLYMASKSMQYRVKPDNWD